MTRIKNEIISTYLTLEVDGCTEYINYQDDNSVFLSCVNKNENVNISFECKNISKEEKSCLINLLRLCKCFIVLGDLLRTQTLKRYSSYQDLWTEINTDISIVNSLKKKRIIFELYNGSRFYEGVFVFILVDMKTLSVTQKRKIIFEKAKQQK